MNQNERNKEHILRLNDVKKRTGLSRSTIYLNVKEGLFPEPISLGLRSVGWLESEVDQWINQRVKKTLTKVSSFDGRGGQNV